MYSVYADDICIYSDISVLGQVKAGSPKLSLEDNASGTLSITLLPTNPGYDTVTRLVTDITVKKEDKVIWEGRVLSESMDFWNNRTLYCEGALAFFNDSVQPPAEYESLTVKDFLGKLIDIHNSKVGANRQFTLGTVTVEDENFPTRYTDNGKTIDYISELIETYGGHFRVRREDSVRYLDYFKEYPDTSRQTIQFGSNLFEFAKNGDSTDFATVIIPLGERLSDSPIEALDAYLTVESVNDGKMYVESEDTVPIYGRIEEVVSFDDVSDASVLLEKAKEYLKDTQFDSMELEVSALDLHYLDRSIDEVNLLDEIRVLSRPHGLDKMFAVRKLEIPLDKPEETTFTLGDTVKTSLTDMSNKTNAQLKSEIGKLPKKHTMLKEAKDTATELMNMATTGFITITRDEYGSDTLYISNTRDYTAADKLWKWNLNGLGYSNDGGKTFGLAMTMDGAIVADYITAGILNGDVIRTGVIRDPDSNVVMDLINGTLTMKKGSIDIGDGNFTVDENGNIFARRGTFAGTLDGVKGTFAGVVQAETFLDANGNDMMANGKFKNEYLEVKHLNVADNFIVDENGNVTMNGDITLSGGNIIWGNNTPVKYRYSVDGSTWHETMTDSDMYRQDSLDGGKTWGSTYQFRGRDGHNGSNGSDASVTRANIVRAMLDSNPNDGLYTTIINGVQCLGINATAIVTGVLQSIDIIGARFYELDPNTKKKGDTWLEIGQNETGWGGMILKNTQYYGKNNAVFTVYNGDGDAGSIGWKGDTFIFFDTHKNICPEGTWDFSGATVVNFTPKFT